MDSTRLSGSLLDLLNRMLEDQSLERQSLRKYRRDLRGVRAQESL